jgi:adenine phosphoribosyltransferase
MELKKIIRNVPDFPIKGVQFKDITTVLQDPKALKYSIDEMSKLVNDIKFDMVLGPESRGFIFGVPMAYNLNKGFVPIRKPGKLPYKTISKEYELEYGNNKIEMHIDAIKKGQKVIIVDDLLATGGTCKATIELVEEVGATVEAIVFLIELEELKGREVLKKYNVQSVLKY